MSDKPRRVSIVPIFECEDCGEECEQAVVYDPHMGERVNAWVCPACDSRFYREDEDGEVRFRGLPF